MLPADGVCSFEATRRLDDDVHQTLGLRQKVFVTRVLRGDASLTGVATMMLYSSSIIPCQEMGQKRIYRLIFGASQGKLDLTENTETQISWQNSILSIAKLLFPDVLYKFTQLVFALIEAISNHFFV